jgi:diguanylate cyclase (GGDEF)-like protein
VSLGLISGLCFGLPDRLDADGVRAFDGNADRKTGPDGIVSPVLRDDARQMLHRFRDWMTERDPHGAPWVSFDNLVREVLRGMTGARRVRCYRLNVAGELTPLNGANPAEGRTATIENPLIGHVLVTGRRFCARSSTSGAMIEELADGSDVPYAWVVPIRSRRRTCGLITAEEFDKTSVGEARLELAADLIEEFWCHLQKAEGLRLACAIDRPSGVLNRVEILGILDQTVEQCYANHEPVVMLALAVEGIRTMDDGGQWDARNHVVEAIGKTMQERLRRDDVIGRFSDDRFIVVLRRLDVALAHLIAHKILGAAEQALQTQFPDARLRLRVGLAGSGFEQVPPQKLLLDAFDAITEARQQNLSILPASKEVAAIAETA